MQRTIEHLAEYHRLTKQAIDESLRDMRVMLFDKEHPQHLNVVCIYATIVQSACECMVLLEKSSSITAVAGMLRSIVESYADLCASIAHPRYVERMIATFYDQKLRLLASMRRSPDNPFHSDMAKQLDPQAEHTKVTAELAVFKARGQEPLKAHERFGLGDLKHIYESIYWNLCLQGHNDVSTLQRRHLKGEGANLEVVVFRENEPGEIALYFDALSSVLIDCASRIHAFFDTKMRGHYETRSKELQTFREAVHARGIENAAMSPAVA
jgi:hypothetical protein